MVSSAFVHRVCLYRCVYRFLYHYICIYGFRGSLLLSFIVCICINVCISLYGCRSFSVPRIARVFTFYILYFYSLTFILTFILSLLISLLSSALLFYAGMSSTSIPCFHSHLHSLTFLLCPSILRRVGLAFRTPPVTAQGCPPLLWLEVPRDPDITRDTPCSAWAAVGAAGPCGVDMGGGRWCGLAHTLQDLARHSPGCSHRNSV